MENENVSSFASKPQSKKDPPRLLELTREINDGKGFAQFLLLTSI
jgi:hypothetical protein